MRRRVGDLAAELAVGVLGLLVAGIGWAIARHFVR